MELILRMNAILKRTNVWDIKSKTDVFTIGKYVFYYSERKLKYADQTEKTLSVKVSALYLKCLIVCPKTPWSVNSQNHSGT